MAQVVGPLPLRAGLSSGLMTITDIWEVHRRMEDLSVSASLSLSLPYKKPERQMLSLWGLSFQEEGLCAPLGRTAPDAQSPYFTCNSRLFGVRPCLLPPCHLLLVLLPSHPAAYPTTYTFRVLSPSSSRSVQQTVTWLYGPFQCFSSVKASSYALLSLSPIALYFPSYFLLILTLCNNTVYRTISPIWLEYTLRIQGHHFHH